MVLASKFNGRLLFHLAALCIQTKPLASHERWQIAHVTIRVHLERARTSLLASSPASAPLEQKRAIKKRRLHHHLSSASKVSAPPEACSRRNVGLGGQGGGLLRPKVINLAEPVKSQLA